MKSAKSKSARGGASPPRESRTDGQATRGRILEAAGALIAHAGFAHTTGKQIAERAGVSLASINYHFESREGLYRALLVEAHQRFVSLSDLRELASSDLSASEKLKAFIDRLVTQATHRQSGWHVDVLSREILAPSPHIGALTQTALTPKLAVITEVLSELTGIPPGNPGLLRCFLSAMAPCTVLLLMARGVPGPVHDIRQMPQDVISDHLHRFALGGLEAIGREYIRKNGLE
ncbi:MAG TPA: TetR/AcrR family transcriptional regulator [Thermomonas sp.]|nr:TetR/AcrR family transcriptional regulator [Thermomonas sp.]